MIILSWNCRGLGNLRTIHELRPMVREKKPNLMFLMETKLRKNKIELIRTKIGFNNMFVVECVGKSGGLALFWEDGNNVEVQNFSHRHINAIVHNRVVDVDWKFTGFYGHPDSTKHHEAWQLLKILARMSPDPWVCIGDFNKVLTSSEKLGGNARQQNLMQAFQQTLEECSLTDLGFVGPKFTWSNCQEGVALIQERLDRGVANLAWINIFPDAEVAVNVSSWSDHALLILNLL
jgi:exonuclease III